MEIAIAVFLGLWLTVAGEMAFRRIRKELTRDERKERDDK